MTDEDLKECPFCDSEEDDEYDEERLRKSEAEMKFQSWREHVLSDPRHIYAFLKTRVHAQDYAIKQAAIILYNHTKHLVSRNVFCGQAGSGKTYIWQVIKNSGLYPNIIIHDAATMTCSGFSGSNKIISPLRLIDTDEHDIEPYILVMDEVDKMICPRHTSSGENVSSQLQSEWLTYIYPSTAYYHYVTQDSVTHHLNLETISWVLCGSFAEEAEEIARKSSCSGLGFCNTKTEAKAFDRPLTIYDLIDFGMIPEIASRLTRVVCLNKLTYEDFNYLLLSHQASPINELEHSYGLEKGFIRNNILTNDKVSKIASDAFNSGLGVRAATSAVVRELDEYIFDHFDEI